MSLNTPESSEEARFHVRLLRRSADDAVTNHTISLNTLEFTSEAGVRAVLLALCADDAVKQKALGLIAKLEPQAANLAANHIARNGKSLLKRKATGNVKSICIQCGKAFDEGRNNAKKCWYHPGELEPYDKFWRRYNMEDAVTVESHYEKYPYGFIWSCCVGDALNKGCRWSRHVSDPRRSKRARNATTGPREDDVGSPLSSCAEEEVSDSEEGEKEYSDSEEEEKEKEQDPVKVRKTLPIPHGFRLRPSPIPDPLDPPNAPSPSHDCSQARP